VWLGQIIPVLSFDLTKKASYICRPHRGVEQYPSIPQDRVPTRTWEKNKKTANKNIESSHRGVEQ